MCAQVAVGVVDELRARFPGLELAVQPTADEIPTVWVPRERALDVVRFLKTEAPEPYRMLYDLTAIDERAREHRAGQPESDFTIVYHLLSFDRNSDVRLKVALRGEWPSIPTITGVFPAAAWYEREIWDMFGVGIDGLPPRPRILNPPWWEGHPLRKEEHCRATDMGRLHIRYKTATWLRGLIPSPFMRAPMPKPKQEEIDTLYRLLAALDLPVIDLKETRLAA